MNVSEIQNVLIRANDLIEALDSKLNPHWEEVDETLLDIERAVMALTKQKPTKKED